MPAATPQPPVRWTRAMLEALPEDRQRHEIIDGVHYVTPSPAAPHQFVVSALFGVLLEYLRAEPVGWALSSPSDIELAEDTIVQPDLFVLHRTGDRPPRSWAEGGLPILAIEVLSPSSRSRDRIVKRPRYQRAGIAEYWIVDAESRLVERWRPEDERPEIITETLRWHPVGAATELAIPLLPIFDAVAPA
ncbi:MAG: Uma2 family endonuclease [Gemmatimonadaceae bacterium]|nr:Uma2 family endonuclease [Gemmatimonadaceae bacterium]